MEILRHGNSLQSDLGEMSAWPVFQASYQAGTGQDEHKQKYFYQNNEFFKTNEGDKAIREILHLLEEKDQTYLGPEGERPVTDQYLQSAILCASLLAIILILAILVVHRKHTRSLQVNAEGRPADPRDTVIVVSGEDNSNTTTTTTTFICDSRDVESNLCTSSNQTSQL